MTDPAIDIERLPRTLRELIECIGLVDAMRLIEQRGGAWICVPAVVSTNHSLAEMLSPAAFVRLVEWYGGERLALPKYDSVARQIRHRAVVQLRREGFLIDDIARRTGYTARRVWQILEQHREPPIEAQLGLDL